MNFYRGKQAPKQPRPVTKVKFLTTIAGNSMPEFGLVDFGFMPGQVTELDAELAQKWIASGIAEAVPQVLPI